MCFFFFSHACPRPAVFQSPRIPGSSRDYSSTESCHSRWKASMPLSSSSSSSSTLCDRPWAESSYGGRSKPVNTRPSLFNRRLFIHRLPKAQSYATPFACKRLTRLTASSPSAQVESERGLGSYSGLLGSAQDDESKRAKLSYTSRSAYSRMPSASPASSTYSNMGGMSGALTLANIHHQSTVTVVIEHDKDKFFFYSLYQRFFFFLHGTYQYR